MTYCKAEKKNVLMDEGKATRIDNVDCVIWGIK